MFNNYLKRIQLFEDDSIPNHRFVPSLVYCTILEVRPPSEVVGDEVVVLAALALDDHHALRVGQLRDDLTVPSVAHLKTRYVKLSLD